VQVVSNICGWTGRNKHILMWAVYRCFRRFLKRRWTLYLQFTTDQGRQTGLLAIVGPKRAPELLDVPAMPEIGFPSISSGAWTALMAPRDTPPAILAKLNVASNAALNGDTMKNALARLGAQPRGGTQQDLADHIQREVARWKPIVATLNLKVD